MKIDFSQIDETSIPAFKGGEGSTEARMYIDPTGLGKVMLGSLQPGCSIGTHTHETSSEIIYILSGKATCLYDDEAPEELSAGECHCCPKGHTHSLRNDSDAPLTFFAVVPEQ